MRNRWEDQGTEELDEPVTLTARQLRSLKRGARFGLFAVVLALAATGLAGWTSFQGAKQAGDPIVSTAAEQPRPAESGEAQAATATPGAAPGSAVPGGAPSPPAGAAPAPQSITPAAQSGKPAPAATRAVKSVSAVPRPGKLAPAPGQNPVTENFGASTNAAASTPIPNSAMPVAAEPQKPVAQDSSAVK